MLYLKAADFADAEQIYRFVTAVPEDENGFTNSDFGCSYETFCENVLPKYLNNAKGIGLPNGWVPCTEYFLWENDTIVGWFRLRHYLSESLATGSGHIGYAIGREHRGKGCGTEGLRLMLQIAREKVPEDEIYLRVLKSNPASLKVMLKNGAYIHHEDEEHILTRIKK